MDSKYKKLDSNDHIGLKKRMDCTYSYVVLVACLYSSVFVSPMANFFSLQFSTLTQSLGLSSLEISLVINSYQVCFHLMIFMSASLCCQFGPRRVSFVSSLLVCLSYLAMIEAKSSLYMMVCYGVLFGGSSGICFGLNLWILPLYFKQRRGFALTVNTVGCSIGKLLCPLIVHELVDTFGMTGSILLHCGILLQGCVFAILFRPLEVLMEENRYTANSYSLRQKLLDSITALQSRRVLVHGIGYALFFVGYINGILMVSYYMLYEGYSHGTTAFTLTSYAISSAVTRVMISFVADKKWFRPRKVYLFGSVLSSFCIMVAASSSDFTVLVSSLTVWGVGTGNFLPVSTLALLDTVEPELYSSAISACGLLTALCYMTIGPLLGVSRTYDHSYHTSIRLCGLLMLANGVIYLLMPMAQEADLENTED